MLMCAETLCYVQELLQQQRGEAVAVFTSQITAELEMLRVERVGEDERVGRRTPEEQIIDVRRPNQSRLRFDDRRRC